MSVGHPALALPRVARPRNAWSVALGGALAVELAALAAIVLDARAREGFLVPAARHAAPSWLAGIAPGLDVGLRPEGLSALLVLMTLAYGVAIACAPAIDSRWPLAVIGTGIGLAVVAPPLLSADAFGYLAWARLGFHGVDPYSHAAIAIGADPIRPFLLWHHGSSPYGPAFTLGSYLLAPLSVAAAFWTFKTLVGLAAAACVALLWRVGERLGRSPLQAVVVFALNPLTLVYAIGGAHNDLLLEVVVLAAILAVTVHEDVRAGASTVLAFAIKASAGVMLPFVLAASPAPRRVLHGAVIAAALMLTVAFAVFGAAALGIAGAVGAQQHIVAVHSIPGEIQRLAGWHVIPRAFTLASAVALAATLIALVIWVRRGADWLTATGWAYVAVLLTSAWILPWYVTWTLPFAALSADRRLLGGVWALTLSIVVLRSPWLAAG